MLNTSKNTLFIKQKALELGFDFCGISKADFLEEEAPRLENWLKNNMQGQMSYMANHFDKRLNPTLLVEGAKSVVSLLFNYFPEKDFNKDLSKEKSNKSTENQQENPEENPEKSPFKISKYAYGEDYHFVVKERLKLLLEAIKQEIGEVEGRAFVDSAPVMDKAWAKKSGAGWIGKNANLINKNKGSFFFIAELIIDLKLDYDAPTKDYCGTCTRCIDACPTAAIVAPYVVDGSRCISYFTIELKEQIPKNVAGMFDNWVFGCDICQDVCPWNRFSTPHKTPEFAPNDDFTQLLTNSDKKDWLEITDETFKKVFKKSALKRTKLEGLKRNIAFVVEV